MALPKTQELAHPPDERELVEHELFPTPEDPFPYGWRYVIEEHNGQEELVQVPLTLDDVLHPQMEDYVNQTDEHYLLCKYLHTILQWRLRDEPSAVVLCDVMIDGNVAGIRAHAPDITVLRGGHTRPYHTAYHLEKTGGSPVLVIEVTSGRTRLLDVDGIRTPNKFQHYAQIGIPYYIIVDEARRVTTHLNMFFLGFAISNKGFFLCYSV